MADITMCVNASCPKKADCYRFNAKPSMYRQSVSFFNYTIGLDGVNCEHFINQNKFNIKTSNNSDLVNYG